MASIINYIRVRLNWIDSENETPALFVLCLKVRGLCTANSEVHNKKITAPIAKLVQLFYKNNQFGLTAFKAVNPFAIFVISKISIMSRIYVHFMIEYILATPHKK